RPRLGVEAETARPAEQDPPLAPVQRRHAPPCPGRPARLQLRLQGLPAGGAAGDRRLRRAPPLHPRPRLAPRLHRGGDRGAPPPAPARGEQVRLGPPLQGAPRPHHRALHHPLHPPAAPPLRRHRPRLRRRRGDDLRLPRLPLVRRREPFEPAAPAARSAPHPARDPDPDHRAGGGDDHLQELPAPRQLLDQGDGGVRGSGPPLNLLFLTQTYPRFEGDTAGPFIRDLARGLARRGDRVTVLAPHAAGVPGRWEEGTVEVVTFRYAPERHEVLGYGRSLEADERVKGGAAM